MPSTTTVQIIVWYSKFSFFLNMLNIKIQAIELMVTISTKASREFFKSEKYTRKRTSDNAHKGHIKNSRPNSEYRFRYPLFLSSSTSSIFFKGTTPIQNTNSTIKNGIISVSDWFIKQPSMIGVINPKLMVKVAGIGYLLNRMGLAEYIRPSRGRRKKRNNVK